MLGRFPLPASGCRPVPVIVEHAGTRQTQTRVATPAASSAPTHVRESRLEVYVISDLHTDYPENMEWVEQLAASWGTSTKQSSSAVGPNTAGTRPTLLEADAEHGKRRRNDSPTSRPASPGRRQQRAEEGERPVPGPAGVAAAADGAYDEVQTVLLVAGDVSDCLLTLEKTLQSLQRCFWQVFFVPGNHELWVTGPPERHGGASDSVQKLQRVLELCRRLGVHTAPRLMGPRLQLAPLHSWHHKSFDREPDIPGIPQAGTLTVSDYAKCRWPESVTGPEGHGGLQLARWADALNGSRSSTAAAGHAGPWEQRQALGQGAERDAYPAATPSSSSNGHGTSSSGHSTSSIDASSKDGGGDGVHVISFSHFVPDQRLTPEKRFLLFPNLVKAVGSDPLRARIHALHPIAHVFGHTHFAWDATLDDGVRYVQAPLCYPPERRHRGKSIALSSEWQQQQPPSQQQQQQQQDRQPPASSNGHQHGHTSTSTSAPWLPLLLYRAQYKVVLRAVCSGTHPRDGEGWGAELVERGSSLADGHQSRQEAQNEVFGEGQAAEGRPEGALCEEGRDLLSQFWQSRWRSAGGDSSRPGKASSAPAPPSSDTESAGSGSLGQLSVEILDWHGELCPPLQGAMWSAYYHSHERTPQNLELAPWVAGLYARRRGGLASHQQHKEA